MSIEAINEQLLRSVGIGVALFSSEDYSLEFFNDVFSSWFEGCELNDSLSALFPELEMSNLQESIQTENHYVTELKIKKKRRTLIVAQTFTRADVGGQNLIILECQNITRIRELESMIESYSNMVERNTREIQREKNQVEKLLLNILPRAAYEEYRDFGAVAPQTYASVTVLALEFENFAEHVDQMSPAALVSELNELYSAFDRIGEQLDCERIRSTGDSYRCLAGMSDPTANHASAVSSAATRFVRYLQRRNSNSDAVWHCKIGIGTGPVVGSVVGTQKYVYDVFGSAVTKAVDARALAASMEVLVSKSDLSDLGDRLTTTDATSIEAQTAGLIALIEN
ncbi:MAG: adenylate/guanylate cyclase domain-containing protein [Gammaproteobacteria bacterium]|nr:adenylate/guanylate cyclase domain-containing protein [Gammaproteobacteria bacterium]